VRGNPGRYKLGINEFLVYSDTPLLNQILYEISYPRPHAVRQANDINCLASSTDRCSEILLLLSPTLCSEGIGLRTEPESTSITQDPSGSLWDDFFVGDTSLEKEHILTITKSDKIE
jgi:hypothetical protein